MEDVACRHTGERTGAILLRGKERNCRGPGRKSRVPSMKACLCFIPENPGKKNSFRISLQDVLKYSY